MADPLATIHMGRKLGGRLCSFLEGAGSSSNTKPLGPRLSSIPSGIFIHPAVWHNGHNENWGCAPFRWELGPHITQRGLDRETYLCTNWYPDASSRLATIDHHTTTILWSFFWDHPGELVLLLSFPLPVPTSTISPFFTSRKPLLPPNQQCQNTEGN